nr:hypothetical protein [Tanacetum cinerariifolium]
MSEGDCSHIIDNLPRRLSEVKYIPGELLNQRLSLDEDWNNYWRYDLDTRIAYIKHLSDALKVAPQYDRDLINLLRDFRRSPWLDKFSKIMGYMEEKRGSYEYKNIVVHLILFMRNLFTHINDVRHNIKDEERSDLDLGETDVLVEADF